MEITRKELLIILYHMCYYLNEVNDNKCVRDFCNYLFDKYDLNDKIIFIGIKD